MRDLKRTAIWLAALVAIVFAGDRLLSALLEQVLTRSRFRFSRIYAGGSDAKIVIVGDSRGVHSFYAPAIERETGQSVLNLSFNSLSPVIAEALLADYLDRNPAPRVVVVEVTSSVVGMDLASQLLPYAGLSPRLEAIYRQAHPVSARAAAVFHLLRFDSDFFLRALAYLRHDDQEWIFRTTISPEVAAEADAERVMSATPANLRALGRIAALLKERGVTLRLVIAPYFTSPSTTTSLAELAAEVEQATETSDRPLRVWNYVSTMHDPADFADRVHMNERGARKFDAQLTRDGVFAPDRSAGTDDRAR